MRHGGQRVRERLNKADRRWLKDRCPPGYLKLDPNPREATETTCHTHAILAPTSAVVPARTNLERLSHHPSSLRLQTRTRALYEQMFRAEPRKHVSQPTFITVMRRVYGFNTAPLSGQIDQAALHKLGEVCMVSGVEELTALPNV